jgi:hypothetical protein
LERRFKNFVIGLGLAIASLEFVGFLLWTIEIFCSTSVKGGIGTDVEIDL